VERRSKGREKNRAPRANRARSAADLPITKVGGDCAFDVLLDNVAEVEVFWPFSATQISCETHDVPGNIIEVATQLCLCQSPESPLHSCHAIDGPSFKLFFCHGILNSIT